MRVSQNGIALVKHFEGCKLCAYPDPKTGAAPWTVGYGATGPDIGPGVVWTQLQADNRLVWDIGEREEDMTQALHVAVTQGQFDALVSLLFNVGHGSPVKDGIIRLKSGYPSTLMRKLNEGDRVGAREQFGKWVSPGSSVERGLRKRRAAEVGLWDGMDAASAIVVAEATA